MNSKIIVLLIIICLIISCSVIKQNKSSESTDEDKIQYHSKLSYTDSNQAANFECDDFTSKALNNYSIATITKKFRFLNCTKEAVVNIHNTSIIDTIYTLSNHKNKIQIYRSKQKDIIFTFDVTDSRLLLSGNVKTGITRDIFYRKFQIPKSTINKVQIGNSDRSMKFNFYFDNNKLTRIKSDLYLD